MEMLHSFGPQMVSETMGLLHYTTTTLLLLIISIIRLDKEGRREDTVPKLNAKTECQN